LRDQPRGETGPEEREVDVVRPPRIVMIAPGIGAGLDRREPVPAAVVGIDAAFAAKIRIRRRVVLVGGMLIAARCVGLPDLDDRAGDRPTVLVGDPAVPDDALPQRRFAVQHRQVGDWRKQSRAKMRTGDLGDRMRQRHQTFSRMPLMRAAVSGRVIGRLRSRLVRPERDPITRALHFCTSLAGCVYYRLSLFSDGTERVGRVDVDEDGIVVHLDLGDELGMLADQVLGADIAG